MDIVDAHCHAGGSWYEPIESLLFQMERNGVGQAVLVQFNGQTDNDYLFECADRHAGRLAVVVLVDHTRPDAEAQLERHAARGARGVRLSPNARSPGDDPLAIWAAAARLGLAVSCPGEKTDFASSTFAELVEAFPRLPIVMEHLGSLAQRDREVPPYEMRTRVFSLARYPNVSIKLHGLGELVRRASPFVEAFPFAVPLPPFFEMAYQAFGPARMMWGSDFPPVSGREGYGNALKFPMEHLADKPEEARRMIFGGTARRIFRLGAP